MPRLVLKLRQLALTVCTITTLHWSDRRRVVLGGFSLLAFPIEGMFKAWHDGLHLITDRLH